MKCVCFSVSFCPLCRSNEALQSVGIMKNANEMENQVFQKVNTQEEYRTMIAKVLKHMQSKCDQVLTCMRNEWAEEKH